ncbi:MAG: DUF1385 domain-containing protein [Chloroflexi bacterium]|nr:DUF1385 domain-containing protein [Chloroflexota bacterium]MDK1044250.1 DUF1385 domain-containing protein [Anaerolineales bacterium]MCH8339983.1 DUF1385 domain-containing protein [Chloroflexota bacterium]MCH8876315.1 DUF1385 domain-containing protein [Chloroflexota bacterium]MCI0773387.1 DUF1385 domain-containing protein [Chloroflexota bacterium]
MSATKPLPNYGGQAVIEGVLMRGTRTYSIAVRAPDGTILIESQDLGSIHRVRWLRVPFLRGLFVLWESLVIGVRALTFSANAQAEDESERLEGTALTLTLVGSIAIALFGFLLLPAGVAAFLQRALDTTDLATNLMEGVIRLGLLIGYVWSIGRVSDIDRVYGYHGAEHMTIHAFEAGASLTPESIRAFPREHPRCGTAFLLTVVLLSILLFSLIGPLSFWVRLASRIAFTPVLASMAYEYIRFTARFADRGWAKLLMWPNLALQRLTTRTPSREMIEVAVASFEAMRRREAEGSP